MWQVSISLDFKQKVAGFNKSLNDILNTIHLFDEYNSWLV